MMMMMIITIIIIQHLFGVTEEIRTLSQPNRSLGR
jgi:hypothetical protein